jgi:hypothetical protein
VLDPMDCLRDGVPPSLLIDLLGDTGPDAGGIYRDELAEDLSWTVPIPDRAPRAAVADLPTQPTSADAPDASARPGAARPLNVHTGG